MFITPKTDVAFALNVPQDSTTDLYFSIRMSTSLSWGAIGLGSNKMKGSLMLVMYSASSSLNFTLSPRIASGHCEPVYSSEIQVKSLAGTGLVDSATYLFNGKCSNCRAWKGGSINVTNTAQKCTYGIGPKGGINSDDFNAPLDYHQAYGSFTIDMIHATGLGGIPEIGNASIATTAGEFKSGKSDAKALMHAIFMISSFVGLFPLGILLLRVGKSVRWHLINQAVAFALSFLGTVMGIIASTSYNRVSISLKDCFVSDICLPAPVQIFQRSPSDCGASCLCACHCPVHFRLSTSSCFQEDQADDEDGINPVSYSVLRSDCHIVTDVYA